MAAEKRPVQFVQRVLVVEDDYQLADVLAEVLTYENCTADTASNGMEAMEKLRSADYDAVICDLMMPRVDGEALYNQAAQLYPHLSDRFLFITGNAALRSGLTDFVYRTGNNLLEKPFEIEQLRTALKETFRR